MQNVSPACSTHSNAGGKRLEDQGLTASPAIMEGPVPPCDPFLSDMATLRWLPGCLGPFVVTLLVGSPIPVAFSDVRSCPCTQGCCPAGWYQYRDSCYYPVTATKGWWKAETDCKALVEGAHLASVHSAEENNFIYQLMGTPKDYEKKEAYWLGGRRDSQGQLEGEGSWRWTDGSAWHYHNFGNGKPDRITAETFVASWKLDQDAITWDNYEASLEFMSVCKRSLD
ncbi:dromaiocalcin-1-like [Trachemys scripta elegans]|uniref:dromaiocalcin-1-like n=1 Tax=Trachemys scripta elegans TaxID=31138 RepID=UPI001551AE19|nr:dromaiocalcin-1-like [Trachemys scripta elegans]